MSFHVNTKTGETGECGAVKGKCPFGNAENHYTSAAAARTAFEEAQAGSFSNEGVVDEQLALKGATVLGDFTIDGTGRGSISDLMDFDHVVAKDSKGTFYTGMVNVYAPEFNDIDDHNAVKAEGGWSLITAGMSNQQGYNGPWLAHSEQMEGPVAGEVFYGQSGYYVAVVGSVVDEEAGEFDTIDVGWSIAYRPFNQYDVREALRNAQA